MNESQLERMRARSTPAAELMRPYTIGELVNLHNLSRDTVTRLYENEPGVVILERRNNGRRYRTIRVPNHVFLRVINRMIVKSN